MAIYFFLMNGVLRAWQWSVLRYQETCVASFKKISQFLLKLQLAWTDGQTDRPSPGFQLFSSS